MLSKCGVIDHGVYEIGKGFLVRIASMPTRMIDSAGFARKTGFGYVKED